jgi:hypothetical protein
VAVGIAFDDGKEASFAGAFLESTDVRRDQVKVDLGPDSQAVSERDFTWRAQALLLLVGLTRGGRECSIGCGASQKVSVAFPLFPHICSSRHAPDHCL